MLSMTNNKDTEPLSRTRIRMKIWYFCYQNSLWLRWDLSEYKLMVKLGWNHLPRSRLLRLSGFLVAVISHHNLFLLCILPEVLNIRDFYETWKPLFFSWGRLLSICSAFALDGDVYQIVPKWNCLEFKRYVKIQKLSTCLIVASS